MSTLAYTEWTVKVSWDENVILRMFGIMVMGRRCSSDIVIYTGTDDPLVAEIIAIAGIKRNQVPRETAENFSAKVISYQLVENIQDEQ